MNHYLVTVKIFIGEIEKSTQKLVQASTKELAIYYGIYSESHACKDLEWQGNVVLDLGGEFCYKATAKEVSSSDLVSLSKYMIPITCNYDDLMSSGDFPELMIPAPTIFNETYKTVAISTCHMTEDDSKQLDLIADEDCSMVAVRPTGYFVKLFDVEQDPDSNVRKELSDELNSLILEAANQGFRCIEFDRDADVIEGITQFEW